MTKIVSHSISRRLAPDSAGGVSACGGRFVGNHRPRGPAHAALLPPLADDLPQRVESFLLRSGRPDRRANRSRGADLSPAADADIEEREDSPRRRSHAGTVRSSADADVASFSFRPSGRSSRLPLQSTTSFMAVPWRIDFGQRSGRKTSTPSGNGGKRRRRPDTAWTSPCSVRIAISTWSATATPGTSTRNRLPMTMPATISWSSVAGTCCASTRHN